MTMRATVSGSFHRHLDAVHNAVQELRALGVDVLSPRDPRVVAARSDFLFVASDHVRSVRMVQDRHFESIRASDFLWLITPDGYVGQSASMELGYAIAVGTPVFSADVPYDLTLRQYVRQAKSMRAALECVGNAPARGHADHFLIDPYDSVELAHRRLEGLTARLRRRADHIDDAEGAAILDDCRRVSNLFRGHGRDRSE